MFNCDPRPTSPWGGEGGRSISNHLSDTAVAHADEVETLQGPL
jgi:hypothetical protein